MCAARSTNPLDCFVSLAMTKEPEYLLLYQSFLPTTSTPVIASVAWQSSNMKVRHSAHIYYLLSIIYYLLSIIYYLCSKKIPRHLAGAGEHKLYFYLHAPCDTATAWFSIHTLPDGVHAEFTNVIVFASAGL